MAVPQAQRARGRRPQPPDSGHAGLGEEDEISLNFDQYSDGEDKGRAAAGGGGGGGGGGDAADSDRATHDAQVYGDGKATTVHRSKDAGKTCKERFSYSSFDAGATVLKTAAGAKNARAILVENKDTYMLLECAAASKYVIVELSDDILVDTIVLANFEFFSSMIRHFRVSVSDRYPVKVDKWRELGTFEARNSRDIQPFLVENPQIWAKYVRIEFLTHYGNEYYCPVSLLRVHGSRMLDSWKDSETGRDDDPQIEGDNSSVSLIQGEATSESPVSTAQAGTQDGNAQRPNASSDCSPADSKTQPPPPGGNERREYPDSAVPSTTQVTKASTTPRQAPPESAPSTPAPSAAGPNSTVASPDSRQAFAGNATGSSPGAASANGSVGERNSSTVASPSTKSSVSGGLLQRHHEAAAASRGEFDSVAPKQHGKVTGFLNELNQTVLAELRNIREQYDQIWQSTVLALESQAQRSERDMMALSTRLNVLADEVVFQKRMAIVQAVILLSCLFLVIFSRGVALPSLGPLSDHGIGTSYTAPSTPGTPRRDVYRTSRLAYQGTYQDKQGFEDPHVRAVHSQSLSSVRGELAGSASPDAMPTVHLAEAQKAPSEYRRLSPPLTPNMSPEDTRTPMGPESPEPDIPGEPSSTAVRRSANLTHLSSRKPLPSLPEHPSPPR
ncbi:hypothetical protein ACCO45_007223 [Purpureocillium lilacinum]|uniref:Uncharacterized protein n=1 Tax=Purpureocillium lilacinum TaxID=33203 RepID=A0ACC4DS15_PURLI